MFGVQSSIVNEEDTPDDEKEKIEFNAKNAVSYAQHLIDAEYGKDENKHNLFSVKCGSKQSIKESLKFFDIEEPELKRFSESKYKNAIAAIPVAYASDEAKPSIFSESTVSDDIFSILFEDDDKSDDEKKKDGEKKPEYVLPKIDSNVMA